jgi:hypothetical protein
VIDFILVAIMDDRYLNYTLSCVYFLKCSPAWQKNLLNNLISMTDFINSIALCIYCGVTNAYNVPSPFTEET